VSFLEYEDISIIGFDHTTRCNLKCAEIVIAAHAQTIQLEF
jgi:hypothetical protein